MRTVNPDRVRRSVHFVPGPVEKMLMKSIDSEADTLVLDLEDAVAPTDKTSARSVIADWLAEVDFGTKEVAIRINPLDTPWGLGDLEATMRHPPDLFMVPKAERLSELQALDTLIGKYELRHGREYGSVGLMPIGSETPLSAMNLAHLVSEPRVCALTWGAEDLAASIGAASNRDTDGSYLSTYASCRDQTVLAAKTHDVQAIDTVFVKLNDAEGLQEDCKIARDMGFTGKLTIHPDQIPVVNEAFTPTEEAIAYARRLIEAFAEARREGRNAFRFEGQMVDAPHLTQAEALLARADQIGKP